MIYGESMDEMFKMSIEEICDKYGVSMGYFTKP